MNERVTVAELERLAAYGRAADDDALLRVLAELACLRGQLAGWTPPSHWRVVHAESEAAWLAARDAYLTASDVASVLGVGRYADRDHAVRRKALRGHLASTAAMRLGQHLESGVLAAAAEFTGRTFVRLRAVGGHSVLVAHPTIARLAASPDGVELDANGDAVALVEVKCTSRDPQRYYGWDSTVVQLRTQMACTGLTRGHIVVNSGTAQAMRLDVEQDASFVERLPSLVTEFWNDVHAIRAREGAT